MKTNAARLLDTLNIRYELRTYAVDPEDLSAVRVAEKVGLPPAQLFKTLVCRGDRAGVCLAVIRGVQLLLAPSDYQQVTRATVVAIARSRLSDPGSQA